MSSVTGGPVRKRWTPWLLIVWLTLSGLSPVSADSGDAATDVVLTSAKSCKLVVTPQAERRFEVVRPGVYAPDTPGGLGTIRVNACKNQDWHITVMLESWDGLVHHKQSGLKIGPERIYFRVFDKDDGSHTKQQGYVGGIDALEQYRPLDPYGYPVLVSTSKTHPDSAFMKFLIDMETDWASVTAGTYTGTLVFTLEAH